MRHYPVPELTDFAVRILERRDVPPDGARLTAACLIAANLDGVDSHGVRLLTAYAPRLEARTINPTPQLAIVNEGVAFAVVDGDDGLGPIVGAFAMDRAIAKARGAGIGAAVARRSNHFGAAAWFANRAVEAGLIGVSVSNGSPALAPWGGATSFFGANPIAVAIPSGTAAPIVLDMSTSVSSRARIRRFAAEGAPIPAGWALDRRGRPTVDAAEAIAGALSPVGGAKGSGLALVFEVLAGALAEAGFSFENRDLYRGVTGPQGLGHFFLAIDADAFVPGGGFAERIGHLVQAMHDVPPAEGVDRVRVPGELKDEVRRARLTHGIPLPDNEAAELAALGEQSSVSFPAAVDPSTTRIGVQQ